MTTVKEFIITVFGIIYGKIVFKFCLMLSATYTVLHHAFEWGFEPVGIFLAVLFFATADFFSAAIPAYKAGEFQTRKALRLAPNLMAYSFVVLGMNVMEKVFAPYLGSEILGYSLFFVKVFVCFFLCLILFVSAIANLGRNGFIHGKFVDFIVKMVDAQKSKFQKIAGVEDEK